MEVKYCKSCKIEHPLTSEYWYPKRDKLYGQCAVRARERRRIWSKNNKDKIRAYKRKNGYKYKESLKGRYSTLKKECKRRNKNLELSLEQYKDLVENSSCDYCSNDLPKQGTGLDRKNNNLDYTIENCVPCCYECNSIKGQFLTYEEMKEVSKLLQRLRND